MQWDRIEAEWSEMACRASGNGSRRQAGTKTEPPQALADTLLTDTTVGTVILGAVETLDRIADRNVA